jgi:hypothetical protein
MAQKVEAEISIYRAPLTSDYVEAIGSRLVGNLEDSPFTISNGLIIQFLLRFI